MIASECGEAGEDEQGAPAKGPDLEHRAGLRGPHDSGELQELTAMLQRPDHFVVQREVYQGVGLRCVAQSVQMREQRHDGDPVSDVVSELHDRRPPVEGNRR